MFDIDIGFDFELIETFVQMNRNNPKNILNLHKNEDFYSEYYLLKFIHNYSSLIIDYDLKLSWNSFKWANYFKKLVNEVELVMKLASRSLPCDYARQISFIESLNLPNEMYEDYT